MSRTSGTPRAPAADAGPPGTVVFAPFCLDLRAGRLLRGSQPVPLRPKTFAVLRHLAEHPGALVTKDELLDAVWADTAVTENTLTQSIGELRRGGMEQVAEERGPAHDLLASVYGWFTEAHDTQDLLEARTLLG